ncbi:MAG: GGDEF domain-containing protein [Cellvibrionaceae bacterium]
MCNFRWISVSSLLLAAMVEAAPAQEPSSQSLFALSLIVLFLFACFQLWLHRDAHKRPYIQRLITSLAIGVGTAWLITTHLELTSQGTQLSLALVIAVTLCAISHVTRIASFEGLRSLLLQEVAQKTMNLEEKNLELKSTQRQLRIANIELKALSFTDALTGAYNRLYFDRQFLTEWQRARREQEPLSMILVDIDHFKELNDQHGHLVGDHALKHITNLLKDGFQRGSDIACRYGGEEFVILLPNTPPTQALIRAQEVRKRIAANPFIHDGLEISITASFGIGGMVPQPQDEPLSLLHATDQALYYVKRNGRNGCHLASHESTTKAITDHSLSES